MKLLQNKFTNSLSFASALLLTVSLQGCGLNKTNNGNISSGAAVTSTGSGNSGSAGNASGNQGLTANSLGAPLALSASARTAGAFSSFQWNSKEYLTQADHGKGMQSSVSFDNFGACLEPTEAGSMDDGAGASSSSLLLSISKTNTKILSSIQMAYWTQPGESYPAGCGSENVFRGQNTSAISDIILSKQVTLAYAGIQNAIEYTVSYHVPEDHSAASFEAFAANLGADFSTYSTFDPSSGASASLSAGPGLQGLPEIFSNSNQQYAMGVFSPDMPANPNANSGYGRYASATFNKMNVVFGRNDTPAGDYKFRVYVAFGTVAQVKAAMTSVYATFGGYGSSTETATATLTTTATATATATTITTATLTTTATATLTTTATATLTTTATTTATETLTTTATSTSTGTVTSSAPVIHAIYRFFDYDWHFPDHLETAQKSEGINMGVYTFEGVDFSLLDSQASGSSPLYRCRTNWGKHYLSLSANCEGFGINEGNIGYLYASQVGATKPLYRMYNPSTGDHVSTVNPNGVTSYGYYAEGLQGYVY